MKTLFALSTIGMMTLTAGAALAGHANPWTTDTSILLEQYHDTNQARSIGTPGEDEMRGVMTQNAFGKLSDDAGGAQDNAQGGSSARGGNGGNGGKGGGSKGGRK
ncbi:hypothetical protein [Tropicibacter naphthalenivorans]|uniref:Uncharacterized protein n=1 Tax=Tropicibacter naphthalenivorans TaxID=441103 RepID=A0A0P1G7Y1_9RHOB|nr:hypothetical protein [Tropicibacter naphthalenivorans]CUH77624.1 hypothetical protein TRN7648_01572 [Tropicibacter naphthalenivorans]SMC54901.1 hypothetical protein SAMN04488093_10245 [Tropicibacter naphthalenivorans]